MTITARFGTAQSALGYQFFNSAGTLLGSRVTSGISSLPETGSYIATATPPSGSVGVYWNSSTSTALEDFTLQNTVDTLTTTLDALSVSLAAVSAKTANLPSDPADQSAVAALISALSDLVLALPTVEDITAAAGGGLTAPTIAALEAATQILLARPYTPSPKPFILLPASTPPGDCGFIS